MGVWEGCAGMGASKGRLRRGEMQELERGGGRGRGGESTRVEGSSVAEGEGEEALLCGGGGGCGVRGRCGVVK